MSKFKVKRLLVTLESFPEQHTGGIILIRKAFGKNNT